MLGEHKCRLQRLYICNLFLYESVPIASTVCVSVGVLVRARECVCVGARVCVCAGACVCVGARVCVCECVRGCVGACVQCVNCCSIRAEPMTTHVGHSIAFFAKKSHLSVKISWKDDPDRKDLYMIEYDCILLSSYDPGVTTI